MNRENDVTNDSIWPWEETTGAALRQGEAEGEASLAVAFARCFGTGDGARVLRHLRRVTLDRALGCGASDAQLRHLEGQRHLVSQIYGLIAQGADHA